MANAQTTNIQSVFVSASPTTVGASPSRLRFTVNISPGFFNNGDVILFNVPSTGLFTTSTAITDCVSVS